MKKDMGINIEVKKWLRKKRRRMITTSKQIIEA